MFDDSGVREDELSGEDEGGSHVGRRARQGEGCMINPDKAAGKDHVAEDDFEAVDLAEEIGGVGRGNDGTDSRADVE